MATWSTFVIDVDYCPSDPGIRNWFCDSTTYERKDMKAGDKLNYEDSGGLFALIMVKEVSPEKLVIVYREKEYTLDAGHTHACLDEGGRDYTNFLLNVRIK